MESAVRKMTRFTRCEWKVNYASADVLIIWIAVDSSANVPESRVLERPFSVRSQQSCFILYQPNSVVERS